MSMTTGKHARRVLNKLADAVHAAHNLIVKIGSDANHIAVCGKADEPLGVCVDAPDVAEYPAGVELLTGPDTVVVVAAAVVAVGDKLYTAASGKVANAATSGAGATYLVGRAMSAASAADEEVEMEGCYPSAVTLQ
jgi:hypothetical protein